MLGVIAGADPHDPSARQEPVPDYLAGSDRDLRGLRIGIDPALQLDRRRRGDARLRSTTPQGVLRSLGADLRIVRFPDPSDAIRDWPAALRRRNGGRARNAPSRRSAPPTGPGWPGSSTSGAR